MPPKSTPKKATAHPKSTTPKTHATHTTHAARTGANPSVRSAADTKTAVQKARARTALKHTTPAEAAKMKDELTANKKQLKELKLKHAELSVEHAELREIHGVKTAALEEKSARLAKLQKAHEQLKQQSDSHAGASVDTLSTYKEIVEDHSSKLGSAHNDLEETLAETMAIAKELSTVKAEIASLRKSNAALRAAVTDNEMVADETDAALSHAVADSENAHLVLQNLETELDEALAERETTSVEVEICRQQLDELSQRAQAKAVEAASTESARGVELEHGRALLDAMKKQLDGFRDSQNAAESESADLRIEAAEQEHRLELLATELESKTATRDAMRGTLSSQAGSMAQGSAELRAVEAEVRELEQKLATYAAIEVELNERRARQKVSAGLKAKLEEQLRGLREESQKLRQSTVSAKKMVTDTLKGKLAAVQAKNKVEEELAKTLEELEQLQGVDATNGSGTEDAGDSLALEEANAKNIELQSELSRLTATQERLSTEVGALA